MIHRLFLLLSLIVLVAPVRAWQDPVHGYNLDVPEGWRSETQSAERMRNVILLNPDDSIAVGVTSIDAGKPFGADQLVQVFEPTFLSDMLSGGRRVSLEARSQNGMEGRYARYRGPYKSDTGVVQATARIFYTVKGNVGHVVWAIVPTSKAPTHLTRAERVMASFSFGSASRPATGGLSGLLKSRAATLSQGADPARTQQQAVSPPVAAVARSSMSASPLGNRYSGQGAGYEIQYPRGWITRKLTAHSVLFKPGDSSGPKQSAEVTIQNLAHARNGGLFSRFGQLYGDSREQLSKVGSDVAFEKDDVYSHPGPKGRLEGAEMVAAFTLEGVRYRQQVILLPRHENQGFHVWTYTGAVAAYDAGKETARSMLKSWKIHP